MRKYIPEGNTKLGDSSNISQTIAHTTVDKLHTSKRMTDYNTC